MGIPIGGTVIGATVERPRGEGRIMGSEKPWKNYWRKPWGSGRSYRR